nr:MAG TPA: hypothetical protein [Caudoviricetes sp.]
MLEIVIKKLYIYKNINASLKLKVEHFFFYHTNIEICYNISYT